MEDHVRWITGSGSLEAYDRGGWADAVRLLELCAGYRDCSVLEWGCGSGRVTQYLCRLFRRTYAVDIAPAMLEILSRRRLPDLEIHLTTGSDLPAGIEVDVVYSYLCWMHNRKADLPAIFRTCRSVLKPGGQLIFQLPVYEVGRSPESFMDLACWTAHELRQLADETGFEILRMPQNGGAFAPEAIGSKHFELHEWRPRGAERRPVRTEFPA